MKTLLTLAVLASAAGLTACSPQYARDSSRNTDVAATIGNRVVTMQELDDHWRTIDPAQHDEALQALDTGRRTALADMVAATLLADAAKARNMSVDALIDAEIARRVTTVTADDVAAFYEKNASRMRGRSLDQMAGTITQYLTDERRGSARQALISDLQKSGAPVRAMFSPPRHEITVSRSDPATGNSSAPVTIVEFSDFQCPFCQRLAPTLARVRETYGDKVRLIWKDFPLTQIHPSAFKAAEAAHCAGEQGKYWEYHDRLFASQQALQPRDLKTYAGALGLDRARFADCLDSSRYAARVQSSAEEGMRLGLNSTPTFYINGRRFSGAQPFDAIASAIDQELSQQ